MTTYEASNIVNLVVVKPEIKLGAIDPSVLTVNTNGTERNVMTVYPCDSRGAFDPDGAYLALGLEKAAGRGLGPSIRGGVWREEYSLKVGLQKGKTLKVGKLLEGEAALACAKALVKSDSAEWRQAGYALMGTAEEKSGAFTVRENRIKT